MRCVSLLILLLTVVAIDFDLIIPHEGSLGIKLNDDYSVLSVLNSAPSVIAKHVSPGDVIVKVNGKTTSGLTMPHFVKLLSTSPRPLTITLSTLRSIGIPNSADVYTPATAAETFGLDDAYVSLRVGHDERAALRAKIASFSGSFDCLYRDIIVLEEDGCRATRGFSGKIVLVQRGNCAFLTKALNLQKAGAAGVIIINTAPSSFVITDPAQSSPLGIPVIMLSSTDLPLLLDIVASRSALFSPGVRIAPITQCSLPTSLPADTLRLIQEHLTPEEENKVASVSVVNARGQRIADADMSDIPMDAVMHTTPAALRPKVEPVNSVPCGYFGRNVICSVTDDDASNESAITEHVVFSDVIGSSSSPQTENRIIIMSATVIDLEMSESETLSHLLQWICDSASTATIIWSANKAYSAHPVMLRNRKEVQRVLEERSCGVDLWEAMSTEPASWLEKGRIHPDSTLSNLWSELITICDTMRNVKDEKHRKKIRRMYQSKFEEDETMAEVLRQCTKIQTIKKRNRSKARLGSDWHSEL